MVWEPISVIQVPRMDLVSLDNQGFIFVVDLEGNLYQYQAGTPSWINNFSPPRQARVSTLEAFWTVNIFTFSVDLQEYRILDRFINPIAENRIPEQLISLAKVATLGNNNIIWILDESDLSLKQLDYRRNRIIQHQPLNLILGESALFVTDMREYGNLLFVNIEDEGIFIFDNQGNYIRKHDTIIEQKLSFWKNNLVFTEGEQLILMDFQTGQRSSYLLPKEVKNMSVMMGPRHLVCYGNNQLRIYDIQQSLGITEE
ncbi:hypothetical protein GCM10008106_24590 [Mongoliitalea lutea]|uniref:Uncharacterized protein n=2 Tax=Mongoliitalea lutea TaxID=849756 RepID=A0A8J3CZG5_9BACT|nr:hypothetical protein GCM10008106_24590 [Mongoliitalea lutea]